MALRLRSLIPTVGAVSAAVLIALTLFSHRGVDASSVNETDRALLDSIAQQVEDVYYKPVDTRRLIIGEHNGLLDVLKEHHLNAASVPDLHGSGDQDHDNEILDRMLSATLKSYEGRINDVDVTQGAVKGMLGILGDPYTVYLTPKENKSLEESLRGGNFSGIGVYIIEDPRSGDVLVDPIQGTPADRAGLKPGDTIMAVDGRKIRGINLDLVERLIRGRIGSNVALTIRSRHATSSHVVNIRRDTIHVPSMLAKVEDNIEYIRLADFGDTSAAEIRTALLNGRRKHVRGYILDLRNNGGGLLDAAVEISSLFIPQGTIVSTIDRDGNKDTKSALGNAVGAKPLVVLANRYTASASEITAGAIQDDHAGIVIGTRTFGKGVVQSIYPLNDGALKVTTARYVTPNGRDIQHKGIKPDRAVDLNSDDPRVLDGAHDTQLAAAKAYIARWAGH